jgi:hypothetical protein
MFTPIKFAIQDDLQISKSWNVFSMIIMKLKVRNIKFQFPSEGSLDFLCIYLNSPFLGPVTNLILMMLHSQVLKLWFLEFIINAYVISIQC